MRCYIQTNINPKFKRVYEILRPFHGERLGDWDIEYNLGDLFEDSLMVIILRQNDLVLIDDLVLEREGDSLIWRVTDRSKVKFPAVLYVTNVLQSKYGSADQTLNIQIVTEIKNAESRFWEQQDGIRFPSANPAAIEFMLQDLLDRVGHTVRFEFEVVREILNVMENALFEYILNHDMKKNIEKN